MATHISLEIKKKKKPLIKVFIEQINYPYCNIFQHLWAGFLDLDLK